MLTRRSAWAPRRRRPVKRNEHLIVDAAPASGDVACPRAAQGTCVRTDQRDLAVAVHAQQALLASTASRSAAAAALGLTAATPASQHLLV